MSVKHGCLMSESTKKQMNIPVQFSETFFFQNLSAKGVASAKGVPSDTKFPPSCRPTPTPSENAVPRRRGGQVQPPDFPGGVGQGWENHLTSEPHWQPFGGDKH